MCGCPARLRNACKFQLFVISKSDVNFKCNVNAKLLEEKGGSSCCFGYKSVMFDVLLVQAHDKMFSLWLDLVTTLCVNC